MKWKPASTQPETHGMYIVYLSSGYRTVGIWMGKEWKSANIASVDDFGRFGYSYGTVTHWIELPSSPGVTLETTPNTVRHNGMCEQCGNVCSLYRNERKRHVPLCDDCYRIKRTARAAAGMQRTREKKKLARASDAVQAWRVLAHRTAEAKVETMDNLELAKFVGDESRYCQIAMRP